MYKKSNFIVNVDVFENGNMLLFNTMSGVLGVVDVESLRLLENADAITQDSILNEKDKANLETLLKSGYILREEYDEHELLKLHSMRSRFFNESLSLTIATTLDCNMSCPYCYEKRHAISKKGMCDETRSDLYEFVKRYMDSNPCKSLSVTWYGGEPLLSKDVVYDLSEKFIALCDEKGASYSAGIVTNGVLLDYETAKKLADDYKVKNVQITIDGMPEYHDVSRALIDGTPTFDTIINNIENAKDLMHITLRVNIDNENLRKATELKQLFYDDKGWHKNPSVYFSRIRDYDTCSYEKSCFMSEKDFSEFEFGLTKESYERDGNVHRVYPTKKNIFCTAHCIGSFVIDPEGYLYSCWNHVGIINESFGNVKTGIEQNRNYTKWIMFEESSKCTKCNFFPVCRGGCPFEYLESGETQCLPWVYSYKNNLKLAYEDHIAKKQKTT